MDKSHVSSVNSADKDDQTARKLELMKYLRDLSPGSKNLMVKYFAMKEEKSYPLLGEYLNVGLAFAALGLLIRRENEKNVESGVQLKPTLQRIALETILRRAMSKLQFLAFKAQFMQEKAMEKSSSDAIGKKVEEWQSEKNKLLQQVSEAKADVAEMKKRRAEDAKANAKVVTIFATQEHGWKIERNKLIQEIELCKKQMDILQRQLEDRTPEARSVCKNCKKRHNCIVNLKEQLGEKELEVLATIEEAKVEQIEKNELVHKLALAEVVTADLRERLEKEVKEHESDFHKYQELIIELRTKQQQVEKELEDTLGIFEASDVNISEILNQKSKYERLVEEYAKELEASNEKMAGMMAEKSKQEALIDASNEKMAEMMAEKSKQEALIEVSNEKMAEVMAEKIKQEALVEEANEKMAEMMVEKSKQEALVAEYQPKFVKLQNDIVEKDKVIFGMLNRPSAERDEQHEIIQELTQLKVQLRQTQTEKERWKRIATEWGYMNNQIELVKPIHSLECRDAPEEDKLAEMQRLHDNQVTGVHHMYKARMQELETQLRTYHEQLLQKDNDMLLQITKHEASFSEDDEIAMNNISSAKTGLSNEFAVEYIESQTATRPMQLSVAKDLLIHSMLTEHDRDAELEKWKTLYMESKSAVELLQMKNEESVTLAENATFEDWVKTVKARQAAQLAERHCHEIDSFARQMRARDERLEAFRLQLLKMDKELNERKAEVESMKSMLNHTLEEKVKPDASLQERTEEFEECKGDVKLMKTSGSHKTEPGYPSHPDEKEQEGTSTKSNVANKGLKQKEPQPDGNIVQALSEQKSVSSAFTEAKSIQVPKRTDISLRAKAFARTFQKQETLKIQLKDISVYEQDYGLGTAIVHLTAERNPAELQPDRQLRKTTDLLLSDEEKCCTSERSFTNMSPALLFSSRECLEDQSTNRNHHEQQQSEISFDSLNPSESDSADSSPSFQGKNRKCGAECKATICGFLSRLRPTEDHSALGSATMQTMTNKGMKMELARNTDDGLTSSTVQNKHSSEDLDASSSDAGHTVGSTDTSQQSESIHERATETVFKLAKNMHKIEIQLGYFEKQLKLKTYLMKGSTELEDGGELHIAQFKRSLLRIIPALRKQSRRYQALLGMIGRLCTRVNLNDSLELYSLPYSEAFPSILRLSLRETLNLQKHVNLAGQYLAMIHPQISEEVYAASEEPEKTRVSIQKHLENVSACFKDVQKGLETKVSELIANFEQASAHERRFELCYRKSWLLQSRRRSQEILTTLLPQD
ncbi:hypothetical protein O6H91_12G058300 [Diphasiastrum complanatum]|uniref:Uncharacterized protein n=3 Tax=Diphasiastrum complanatum TaxID=34168 RepID=A0ACC2C277_DIPCM|nr:hypothetical protein O6H91_12G058300 [Diphasiastrum complanatum]KAJ7536156.1 hypothetical protein O6H91_12G058300 [Diphasiastrum complanatum]KAJ7536157.1 hypothetical protein O6H91_12G058300 [Diphasiastrum complanatum]